MNAGTASSATIRPARAVDLDAVHRLLASSRLPTRGVAEALDDFLIAEIDDQIVGAIGLERYGADALLRSAVVAESVRGTGLGSRLVAALLSVAEQRDVHALFLLTTTAEDYFPRFGFTRITRDEVPETVRQSVEFRGACPDSAIVMRRNV